MLCIITVFLFIAAEFSGDGMGKEGRGERVGLIYDALLRDRQCFLRLVYLGRVLVGFLLVFRME